MIDVYVKSGKKGSNPGGKVEILVPGENSIECYLKYCNTSELENDSLFLPQNQPIYESILFNLARQLGLNTPVNRLLINNDDLHFIFLTSYSDSKISNRNKFYFTSEIIKDNESKDIDLATSILKKEKIYRDLLLLHDISGRRQNVFFPTTQDKIIYLDLGCSFVDCVHGRLSQRKIVTQLGLNNKEVHKKRKLLDKIVLETADNKSLNLLEFVDSINKINLKVYNSEDKKIEELINEDEVNYIKNIFAAHIGNELSNYKSDPRLKKS